MLFTDTDSWTYEIDTQDVYKEDLQVDRNKFDNSDYPEGSEFYHKTKLLVRLKTK